MGSAYSVKLYTNVMTILLFARVHDEIDAERNHEKPHNLQSPTFTTKEKQPSHPIPSTEGVVVPQDAIDKEEDLWKLM